MPQEYLVTEQVTLPDLVNAMNQSSKISAEVLRKIVQFATGTGDVTVDLGEGEGIITYPTINKLIANMQSGGLTTVQERTAKLENLMTGVIQYATNLGQKTGQDIASPYWSKLDLVNNTNGLDTDPLWRAKVNDGFCRYPYEAFDELLLNRKLDTTGAMLGGWLMPVYTVNTAAEKRYSATVVGNVVNTSAYPAFTKQVTRLGTAYYQYYYGYYYTWYYYYYNWAWGSYTYSYTTTVTENLSGSMIGQTFQVTQPRVLLGFDIEVVNPGGTRTAAAPKLLFVETEQGMPLFSKVIARGTLVDNVNAANTSTAATTAVQFDLERPVMLTPGKSYAFILVASAAWNVAYSSNADSSGLLFYTQDGQYWANDLAKDACFALRIADFGSGTSTYTVDLKPLSLSGGIASLSLTKAVEAATGGDIQIQIDINNNGNFTPIADMVNMQTLPAYCPLRAVYTGGSQWAMPIMNTQVSKIVYFRPGTTLRYITKDRPVKSNKLQIRYSLLGYDATDPSNPIHSFDPKLKLVDGAQPLQNIAPTSLTVAATADGKYTEFTATFDIPNGVTKYRHWIFGTTATAGTLYDIIGILEI
jgi:hypothetical protein